LTQRLHCPAEMILSIATTLVLAAFSGIIGNLFRLIARPSSCGSEVNGSPFFETGRTSNQPDAVPGSPLNPFLYLSDFQLPPTNCLPPPPISNPGAERQILRFLPIPRHRDLLSLGHLKSLQQRAPDFNLPNRIPEAHTPPSLFRPTWAWG